ncbi:MAG: hypothetical protein J6W50_00365, partial [Bacteroidaceae bacterium]|nr:hypothetical protein [Bacteroidaceae bacterium]
WVGGNPWDGTNVNVYGWAAWNGPKATLALRNGSTSTKVFVTTLREMLNIPANVKGSIQMKKAFADQKPLSGISELYPLDIDRTLTIRVPASSVYVFDGTDDNYDPTAVKGIPLPTSPSRGDGSYGELGMGNYHSFYDLYGRRLQAPPQKGMYIQDGKVMGK